MERANAYTFQKGNLMNTRSRLLHIFVLFVLLLAVFPATGVAAKKKPPKPPKTDKKVVICHRKGKGSGGYVRITVSKKALKAHLKHGDALPGEAVPGQEGAYFDEACNVFEPLRVESGPLEFSSLGWGGWSCPAGYLVFGGGYEGATAEVLVSQPAKPGVGTYPVYPHYTYTPPEEGWVVQNGATPQTLVVYALCVPATP